MFKKSIVVVLPYFMQFVGSYGIFKMRFIDKFCGSKH
jgi:hypothetical protein